MENMDCVSRVKAICKERGIAISKLEDDCGFGNAYIRGLRAGKMPADRLKTIADYLELSMEYLLTGKSFDPLSDEVTHLSKKIRNDAELAKALIKYFNLSDNKKKLIIDTINTLSEE